MLCSCLGYVSYAQKPAPSPVKTQGFLLYRFMEKFHYQPVVWDDSSSARLFNKVVNELDPYKLYFTKNDMTQLGTFRYQLDEEVTGKQWKFLDALMPLYRKKLAQYDSAVTVALAKPFDFSKAESLQWPFADFAADQPALQSRISQYYKWQLLHDMTDSLDNGTSAGVNKLPAGIAELEKGLRERLRKREQRSAKRFLSSGDYAEEMSNLFFNCISWVYDPHSEFMNMAEKQAFESAVSASEYTAGIHIKKNDRGEFVISYLVPGGPAWRSGELHTGDVILKLRTAAGTETDAAEAEEEEELEALLEGSATEQLTIVVKTAAGSEKTINLLKERISSDENIVRSFLLDPGSGSRIGYIELPGFYSRFEQDKNAKGCANDVAKEIIKLKKDNIGSLVLDLRNNGGGSIQEALELAGIFINEGPLCLIKERSGKVTTLRDPNRGTLYDGPLMLLTNGASASASELTSAVLQDYHRALVVGGNTYGKGTAQVVLPLDTADMKDMNPNAQVAAFEKVTMQKFYRVDGTTVQWTGVVPDVVLPDLYQQERLKERYQASALRQDTCKRSSFNALAALSADELSAKSRLRVAANPYFGAISRFTAFTADMNTPRNVPLKWEGYQEYYRKRITVYKELEKADEGTAVFYKVSNNSFDKERAGFFSSQSLEMNSRRIDVLQKDRFLEEACRIMQDWTGTKN